jgi:hypothetical protein
MSMGKLHALTKRLMSAASLEDAADILTQAAAQLPEGKRNWRYFILALAEGLRTHKTPFAVFAKGNSKLPFYSFSTLPQYTCPGAGECLDFCYSFTGWRYPATWARQVQNTLYLRFLPEVIREAFLGLPSDVVVRLYVDGDFGSHADFAFWMNALAARPDIRAYGYSKSWDIIWEYSRTAAVPNNYVLNLSSGAKPQGVSKEQMFTLPFVRGEFVAVTPQSEGIARGFKRYDDPAYHRAVRAAAKEAGMGKVFSCPGKCGECCGANHACGMIGLKVTIAIGTH